MKILLVIPPYKNTIVMEAPNEIFEEFGTYPPLGLLYLAASLRKDNPKHEIKVLDCDAYKLDFSDVENVIKEFKPDIVGVTAFTPTICDALLVVKLVKKIDPRIVTVMGGHHTDMYYKETINLGNIDYIVLGEGEEILPKLVSFIEKGEDVSKISGLVFKKDGELVITGEPGYIKNLDDLPMPARDLMNLNKFQCVLGREKLITTMMSSRGCPYRCTFCYKPLKTRSWRFRSAENIVAEIEQCCSLGIKEIFFFDDNFSVDIKRVEKICDLIIEKGLDITWSYRGRVNTISYEMLQKCKKSGCHRIHFGVETGTDEGLRRIKKDTTTDVIRNAFKLCKKVGITTVGNFMIGLPGEKKEDMFKTIEFAKSIGTDYAEFAILTPFPKTELYDEGIKRGIFDDFWLGFAKNPTPDFKLKVWNEYYSREELFKLLEECLRKFYFDPRTMTKILFSIRSFKEMSTKIRAGMALLNYKKMNVPLISSNT
ncbi:MAG: radical SAM protein [Nanoarchaeota archaeon]